jgi:hypothetical protein
MGPLKKETAMVFKTYEKKMISKLEKIFGIFPKIKSYLVESPKLESPCPRKGCYFILVKLQKKSQRIRSYKK